MDTDTIHPDRDRIQPVRDIPNWSENLVFVLYGDSGNPAGWGHWGRVAGRPHLWEGIFTLYLPDGRLLVHRAFGSSPGSEHTASDGSLSFRCEEPLRRWSVHLDGMMRPTTSAEVAAGTVADGQREPVQLELEFTGVTPTWSAHSMDDQEWADGHLEQAGRITGTIVAGGQSYAVDAHGFRDHSYGARDYAKLMGDTWITGVFPSGRVLLALVVWTNIEGVPPFVMGFVDDHDGRRPVTGLNVPILAGLDGAPGEFAAEIVTSTGTFKIEVSTTHRMNYTMDHPVGMTLGSRTSGDHLMAVECPARLRWDGEETDGWLERMMRLGRIG